MARCRCACWRKFRTPNLKCPKHPDLACLLPSIIAHTSTVGFRSWTLGHCRPGAYIRHWVFSCRRRVRAVILADGRVTRSSVGECCDIVLSCFCYDILNCFYNWMFSSVRKGHTKRILIHSAFVDLFCLSNWFLYLLVGLLIGCLVGCLVIFLVFVFVGWLVGLVGWLWFILVLVDCSLGRTTIISLLDFTEHKSSVAAHV